MAQRGRVMWFSEAKGYGFIRPDGGDAEGKDDVFVHFTGIRLDDESRGGRRNLQSGQLVSYELGRGRDNRQQATEVEVIEPEPEAA